MLKRSSARRGNISHTGMWPQQSFSRSNLILACSTSLQCLIQLLKTPRGEMTQVCVTRTFGLSCFKLITSITDVNLNLNNDHSQLTPDRPPQVESNIGDSSEPLFSMYTEAAEEEDNKMVERWQRDADGILIFVSPCLGTHIVLCINWNNIDWSILCRSCRTPFLHHRGLEAK